MFNNANVIFRTRFIDGISNVSRTVVSGRGSQAALAQIAQERALRFEIYYHGIELANGFGELIDAKEQKNRFILDLQRRASQDLPMVPLDESFLQSLEQGLPPSAGIAVGLDRLVMLLTGAAQIQDVLCFSWDEC